MIIVIQQSQHTWINVLKDIPMVVILGKTTEAGMITALQAGGKQHQQ